IEGQLHEPGPRRPDREGRPAVAEEASAGGRVEGEGFLGHGGEPLDRERREMERKTRNESAKTRKEDAKVPTYFRLGVLDFARVARFRVLAFRASRLRFV